VTEARVEAPGRPPPIELSCVSLSEVHHHLQTNLGVLEEPKERRTFRPPALRRSHRVAEMGFAVGVVRFQALARSALAKAAKEAKAEETQQEEMAVVVGLALSLMVLALVAAQRAMR